MMRRVGFKINTLVAVSRRAAAASTVRDVGVVVNGDGDGGGCGCGSGARRQRRRWRRCAAVSKLLYTVWPTRLLPLLTLPSSSTYPSVRQSILYKLIIRQKDDTTTVMQSVRRLLACTFVAIAVCRCIGAPSCSPDKLARYRVVVRTFWTRDRFPKHFPEWRPQAQWSKVVGKSILILLQENVIYIY